MEDFSRKHKKSNQEVVSQRIPESKIFSEQYFKETTTRDRSLEFFDKRLRNFASNAYKVSDLKEDQLPQKDFPADLKDGLSSWVDQKIEEGDEVNILNLGAGEADLKKDFSGKRGVGVVSIDAYPPTESNIIRADLNKHLPLKDRSFSMTICSFVLPYLEDPVKTINEAIRVTRPGGYILLNGAKRIYLGREGDYFFSSHNSVQDKDLIFYNEERFSGGDWALIKVNNPDFRFNVDLDMTKSFTITNKGDEVVNVPRYGVQIQHETRDLRDLAVFVYK